MTRRTRTLLAATAMAVLLAGCGGCTYLIQKEPQKEPQEQRIGVSDDAMIVQATAARYTADDRYTIGPIDPES
jgi:hypothetical protein